MGGSVCQRHPMSIAGADIETFGENSERIGHFPQFCARMRIAALLVGAFLVSCGGSDGNQSPAIVTIPDMGIYLAQRRCPNGDVPTNCADPALQRASDKMAWRRFDGLDQYEDSVVSDDGSYWVTTWSYWPHGPFLAANGDGGEVYVSDGTTVSICCTQDGGTPRVQHFEMWGLFNNVTKACSEGWTEIDRLDRACRAMVTYPASGM